jgi:hypothetical protein
LFGVVWVVLAIFLIHDSPDTHPRISAEELAYLEPYCLKKQPGKKVNNHFISLLCFLMLKTFNPI